MSTLTLENAKVGMKVRIKMNWSDGCGCELEKGNIYKIIELDGHDQLYPIKINDFWFQQNELVMFEIVNENDIKSNDINVTFNAIEDNIDFTPIKANKFDIGYDVKAYSYKWELFDEERKIDSSIKIPPYSSIIIGIGVSVEMSDKLYNNTHYLACEVHSRSGLGFKSEIVVFNGQIDNSYNNQIYLKIFNESDKPFTINFGDRIAQLEFKLIPLINHKVNKFKTLKELDKKNRGGFGSTGV